MTQQNAWLSLFGRLASNVTAAQAAAELQTVASTLPRDNATTQATRTLVFAPMTKGHPEGQAVNPIMFIALGIVGETPGDFLYRPLTTAEYGGLVTLLVRTDRPARPVIADLREEIRALDPNLPPASIKTMEQRMELPLWPMRTAAGFFATCGSLALILAAVGLFGITYLTVSQRTREFGIRAALGATRARVMRLVIGEGLWLTLPGVAIGLGAAAIAARILANAIFKIGPADPPTFVIAGALQALVALAACVWPAHRATKADPILALRVE